MSTVGSVGPTDPVGGFELLPAIDLRGGRVVRLHRGDPGRETRYGDDPRAVAARFQAAGARRLHIVDLDAALDGSESQATVVSGLLAVLGTSVACQVGGGIRSEETAARYLDAGAARVVIGTALLRDTDLAGRLVRRFGDSRIVAAIDVRGAEAVGDGWRPGGASLPLEVALDRLEGQGVTRVAVTAIERDGTRMGPDLGLLRRAIGPGRSVVASAGVRSIDDLLAIRDIGAAGAIVGKAVYEGDLDVATALERLRSAG